MSVLDYCKQLRLFSSYENQIIELLIKQYANKSPMFDYLKKINLNKIQFYWYCDSDENVMGGFHLYGKDFKTAKYPIYLNDIYEIRYNFLNDYNKIFMAIIGVFDTILHELKHYSQLQNFGYIIYNILQLPYIRNFTIEKQAYKISDYIYNLNLYGKTSNVDIFFLKIKYNINIEYFNSQQKILKEKIQQKHLTKQYFENKLKILNIKNMLEIC